jgi:hypothetical protein
MNIPATLNLIPGLKDKMWYKMRQLYEQVALAFNGNVSFGQEVNLSGVDIIPNQAVSPMTASRIAGGNIDVVFVVLTTPGVANTDFIVVHNLGRFASGYFVVAQTAAGIVYNGAGLTNTTQIALRCNTAGIGVKLLVF